MSESATILDMSCDSRMFWFDKNDDRAIFSHIRREYTLCDGRRLIINPDLIADFVHYHLQTHLFDGCIRPSAS